MNTPVENYHLMPRDACIVELPLVEHKLIEWQQDQESGKHDNLERFNVERYPLSPGSLPTPIASPATELRAWKREAQYQSKKFDRIERDRTIPVEALVEYWQLKVDAIHAFERVIRAQTRLLPPEWPEYFGLLYESGPLPDTDKETDNDVEQSPDTYTESVLANHGHGSPRNVSSPHKRKATKLGDSADSSEETSKRKQK